MTDWSRTPVLADVFARVSPDLWNYYRCIPTRRESGRLVMLMSNPQDILKCEDLQTLVGEPFTAMPAPSEEILRIIARAAGPKWHP